MTLKQNFYNSQCVLSNAENFTVLKMKEVSKATLGVQKCSLVNFP